MSNSPSFLLAVSGVFLVAWYGVRRLNRQGPPRLPLAEPGSPEFRLMADSAVAAEFHEPAEREEPLAGGMVHCPDCERQYPAGVLYCECGAETAEAEEHEDPSAPHHSDDSVEVLVEDEEKLVCVHVAENHWKASLLKGLLENHDIPCATGGNSSSSPYSFSIGYMGEVRIFVYTHHAPEARRLIRRAL